MAQWIAEKKYLTPTKFNMQNYDNDYYFNESYNKTQELFNNANISRPTLDFNSGHKKRNKNILLTIGTRLNTVNNSNTYNNNVGKSKDLLINRSFKVSKNKYVICRKNNFSNNNSRTKDNLKDIESKSMENNRKNNESQENLCKCLNIKDDALSVVIVNICVVFFSFISSFTVDILYEISLVNNLFNFDLDKKVVILKEKKF